jgi:hypothetical protein
MRMGNTFHASTASKAVYYKRQKKLKFGNLFITFVSSAGKYQLFCNTQWVIIYFISKAINRMITFTL